MAVYQVRGPDGRIHEINGPDGATPEQVIAAAQQMVPNEPQAAPAAPQKPLRTPMQAATDSAKQSLTNLAAGAVRGAGSIGALAVLPGDMIADALLGDRKANVAGLVSGQQPMSRNEERRANIDKGLTSLVGSDPNSGLYQTGKIGAEIAGTAGVGPALASTLLRAAPAASPTAAKLAEALATGGFRAGGATGVPGALIRAAGGAATGAASVGMVDPEQAKMGAVIGGGLPAVVKVLGAAGSATRGVLSGPAVPESTRKAVEAGRKSGYVIPPTQAKPTLVNRALEGAAGKLTTAQNASSKNQAITNRLVAEDLGLPPDEMITPEVLSIIRRNAGKAYEAVASTGTIVPGKAYGDALDALTQPFLKASKDFPNSKVPDVVARLDELRSPEFDASSAVTKISEMRELADEAYKSGRPTIGKAYKGAAKALEDAIDKHLQDVQAPAELLDGFRSARQTIAKSYTVEKALNPSTGTIDARKLGSEIKKGKPLQDGMRKAGEFANTFEKAVQTPERMGSLPQVSPLDFGAVGTAAAVMQKPSVIGALLGRPIARSAALSPLVQNRLAAPQSASLFDLLSNNPKAIEMLMRATPVAASGR